MTWMETTVFATILAMTALSYHRHKQLALFFGLCKANEQGSVKLNDKE